MNRAKYYVAVRPQTNDYHAVHKEGCPFISENEKRIYLGKFSSDKDAIEESRLLFKKTECCLFCSKEIKIVSNEHLLFNLTNGDMIQKELRMPVSFHQSLLCCVN
jgi:2-hydroxy-3-keto-5-methylthiopentenyl-1-phosphate phosphatase